MMDARANVFTWNLGPESEKQSVFLLPGFGRVVPKSLRARKISEYLTNLQDIWYTRIHNFTRNRTDFNTFIEF